MVLNAAEHKASPCCSWRKMGYNASKEQELAQWLASAGQQTRAALCKQM